MKNVPHYRIFLAQIKQVVQEIVLVIVERICGIQISDGIQTILTEVSCHFPQSLPVNAMVNISGHDCFLSHPFQILFQ